MVDFLDTTTTDGYQAVRYGSGLAPDTRQGLLLPVALDALELAL
jgi:hypothetical protein